ncbi:SRPBCC family protein [Fontisphaera persica]|uniref:SRPBCC family protein n=1 Tax=Fontisphaera persica TaxID=2974023 RepID=UPI0024C0B800|nr:SRPBCC family protein [Fontisphaera persica]WCJ59974.1 SRPBCC family protein [Fontisphaera persica]
MKTYQLHVEQSLPRPLAEVFPFFADARNLERITPPWLHFSILSTDLSMRVGLKIDYQLKLHGIPLRWQSEITAWEPPYRFVDEQRRGPYRLWRHEHRFVAEGQGTRVIDEVTYALWGGWLLQPLWVKHDLKKIFDYRQQVIAQFLGQSSATV